MISYEECCKLLNKKEKTYTKEEVKAIRDVLYQLAEVVYETKKELNEKS